jgi:hypothetical protein
MKDLLQTNFIKGTETNNKKIKIHEHTKNKHAKLTLLVWGIIGPLLIAMFFIKMHNQDYCKSFVVYFEGFG